jgi:hypothetical protein
MKMHEHDALMKTAQQMLRGGQDIEDVLRFLRSEGCTIIDSIKLTKLLTGMSLGAAKELVHTSQAWRDRREANDRFHDVLEDVAKDAVAAGPGNG